jgi:hydroxymethylglutaryl-CoA lyase
MISDSVELVECPRDAMQGISHYIPVETKVSYLNQLLRSGFDILDFGSFVSPKAIPQLRDTAEVLSQLELNSETKLLAIVANLRGAGDALSHEEISYIGFPFSISPTFQLRNTNSTIAGSFDTVKKMQELCIQNNRELVVYISMAFGNPYGDAWEPSIALDWTNQIAGLGVKTIALSDTVGIASPEVITRLFNELIPSSSGIQLGAHLHCTPDNWRQKTEAAFNAGCRRFDSAIKGFGGCPMAKDELVGNLPTEKLLGFLDEKQVITRINMDEFAKSYNMAVSVFSEAPATS